MVEVIKLIRHILLGWSVFCLNYRFWWLWFFKFCGLHSLSFV